MLTHVCFSWRCSVCNQSHQGKHQCFLQRFRINDLKILKRREEVFGGEYCYFDIETMKVDLGNRVSLVPNLLVFHFQSGSEKLFFGSDCLKEFGDFLFHVLLNGDGVFTIFSHNGARFDMLFILQEFTRRNKVDTPSIFFNGAKIWQIKIGNLRFVDSYKFIPFALKQFAKSFSLNCMKGYFPHGFNTPENQQHVGTLPDKSFYGVKWLNEKEFGNLSVWYDELHGKWLRGEYVFDFKNECINYCRDDVKVPLCVQWYTLHLYTLM